MIDRYIIMRYLKRTAFYAVVGIVLIYTIFPFYWAVVSSLKSGTALFNTDLWPRTITFEHYINVFSDQRFDRNIINSILVAFGTVTLSLILATTASYALGRIDFKGRKRILFTILSISMFPQVAVLSGMFELIRALGLYNNLFGLTLSYMLITLPFTIWVLTSFMRQIPRELEEAAIMDGAKPRTILRRIFLPLLAPAMVTTGLLSFIAAWNEFLFALTFTLTSSKRTVPVAIALISGASEHELPWGKIMAASVMVTLPLIILVLIYQRRIVSGLTAGAVKG